MLNRVRDFLRDESEYIKVEPYSYSVLAITGVLSLILIYFAS